LRFMRVLIKLFYDGVFFKGFQIQPNCETVEGVLRDALLNLGWVGKIRYVSRTDAGVHSLAQIVQIDLNKRINVENFLWLVNSELSLCVRILSFCVLNKKVDVRKCVGEKEYLYIALDLGENEDRLRRGVDFISSQPHDFVVLSKGKKDRKEETVRRVKVRFERRGRFQFFYFRSKGFLWEQVRRTVTLLKGYALGYLGFDDFVRVLRGINVRTGIAPAPAEGLILWTVKTCVKNWKNIVDQKVLRDILLSKVKYYAIINSKRWVFPHK